MTTMSDQESTLKLVVLIIILMIAFPTLFFTLLGSLINGIIIGLGVVFVFSVLFYYFYN